MSEEEDKVEAGTSKESETKSETKDTDVEDSVQDTVEDSEKPAPKKTVRWDTEETEPPPERMERRSSTSLKSRRQSLVGTTGYVSQILEQYVEEEEPEKKKDNGFKKPIRKQTMAERRASIKAVAVDMEYYMEGMMKPSKKKSERAKKFPKLISKEKLEEIISFSTLAATESRESSKWSPAQLFREEPDSKQAVSWVGAYIVGKDYWKEKDLGEERDEKVGFKTDEKRKPWYEIPLSKETAKDSVFQKLKHRSLGKIDALKEGVFDNYDAIRKERLEYVRRETTPLEGLDEEFKLYFQDVCKSSDFLHREHRISMAELDKWLERADILDYSRLTLVNTALCFLASGGKKHRGLSYEEFTQFLQMISLTTGKSMKEIVMRMQACQRAPKDGGK